jgi:hypothetical protein
MPRHGTLPSTPSSSRSGWRSKPSCPSRKLARRGPMAQTDAHLGNDRDRAQAIDARYLHQQRDLALIGGGLVGDPLVEQGDIALNGVEPAECHAQQKAVMFGDTPVERSGQGSKLASHAATGKTRHLVGGGSTFTDARTTGSHGSLRRTASSRCKRLA